MEYLEKIDEILHRARIESSSNWIKATQILFDAIEMHSNEYRLYVALADIYVNQKSFQKGICYYEQAVKLIKNDIGVLFKLGHCYLNVKEYEKAIDCYDRISFIIPEATFNKSIALCKLGRSDEAVINLEGLIKQGDKNWAVYLLLAKLYIELERVSEAIDLLNESEKKLGEQTELNYLRGIAYYRYDKPLQAYVDLKKAEDFPNKDKLYHRMYAITNDKIGKTEEAINILKDVIEDDPSFIAAYYDLISVYKNNKLYDEAREVIKTLKKRFGLLISDTSFFVKDL